mgnify:CR=1 FL=1
MSMNHVHEPCCTSAALHLCSSSPLHLFTSAPTEHLCMFASTSNLKNHQHNTSAETQHIRNSRYAHVHLCRPLRLSAPLTCARLLRYNSAILLHLCTCLAPAQPQHLASAPLHLKPLPLCTSFATLHLCTSKPLYHTSIPYTSISSIVPSHLSPLHLNTSAPLHLLCNSAPLQPLHLCTSKPLNLVCTSAPLNLFTSTIPLLHLCTPAHLHLVHLLLL